MHDVRTPGQGKPWPLGSSGPKSGDTIDQPVARRVRVALLMAQPAADPRVDVALEFKRISESFRRARPEYHLELWPYPRATREDLHRAILAGPDILHIASHGERDGIILHDDGKREVLVTLDELSELLSLQTPSDRPLQCAILNACWSAEIGVRRALRVPYTVGMQQQVSDPAAIEFACGFYDALGSGRDYVSAFQHGRLRGRRHAKTGFFHPVLLQARTGMIGIRSFMQDAEDLAEHTELFMQLEGYFNGRTLRPGVTWSEVAKVVATFCSDPELRHRFRTEDFCLQLHCHLAIATLTGFMLGFEAPVAPMQGRHRKSAWARPPEPIVHLPNELHATRCGGADCDELAVSLSLSRSIGDYVENYLSGLGKFELVDLALPYPNARAITGPAHADAIVEQIVHELGRLRAGRSNPLIHLFASAPAALMFLLGQHQYALGRVRLYELDHTHTSYYPTIDLPFTGHED